MKGPNGLFGRSGIMGESADWDLALDSVVVQKFLVATICDGRHLLPAKWEKNFVMAIVKIWLKLILLEPLD